MKSIVAFLMSCILIICLADGKAPTAGSPAVSSIAPVSTSVTTHWYLPAVPSFLRSRLPFLSTKTAGVQTPAAAPATKSAKVKLVKDLTAARETAKPTQVLEAGGVVINVYGKPESVSVTSSNGMMDSLRKGIKNTYNRLPSRPSMPSMPSMTMPSMPSMPSMPTFTYPTMPPMPVMPTFPPMPAMPTLPSHIKVPYRIQVEGQNVKLPTMPTMTMPTLPPMKIPETLIVHRVEVERPNINLPAVPTMKPIKVQYQDYKPSGPIKLGTLMSLPAGQSVTSADKKKE